MKKTLAGSGLKGLHGANPVISFVNANLAMAIPMNQVWDEAVRYVGSKNPISQLCPCVPSLFSCNAKLMTTFERTSSGMLVDMEILPGISTDVLGNKKIPIWCCEKDHSMVSDTKLLVDEWFFHTWLKAVLPVDVEIHNAIYKYWYNPAYVDVSTVAGFCTFPGDRPNFDDEGDLKYAEFFSGGFGGWSQAADILHKLNVPLDFRFALDHEACANQAFRATFKQVRIVTTFAEACQAIMDNSVSENPLPPLFQANCYEGWWMNFAARASADIACVSCPCPPWTLPNLYSSKSGLMCDVGMLIPETLWRIKVLGCPVMMFENVSTLKQHPQWPVIQSLFVAFGWKILWEGVVNLSDLVPQNRTRYLAVLVRDTCIHDGAMHQLVVNGLSMWPKCDQPTLGSYDAITEVTPEWYGLAEIPESHMQVFQNPRFLPSSNEGKRQRLELISYRLRGPADIFSTIMAAYSAQADFDKSKLEASGLYGSLISINKTWIDARYLLAVETYILLGGCVNTVLPLDRSVHFKILGNAIATPHALLVWYNALRFFMHRFDNLPTIVDCFQMFFRQAFRASKVTCHFTADGIVIRRQGYNESITPQALPAPTFIKLILECGSWKTMVMMPVNFRPVDAFQLINAGLATKHARSLPRPCTWQDETVQAVPTPVDLDLRHLDIGSTESDCVLLLNKQCPLIVKRDPHAKTRSYGFDIMIGTTKLVINHVVITTCAGRPIPFHDPIPQVVFLHDGAPSDVNLCPSVSSTFFRLVGPIHRILIKQVSLTNGLRILEFFRASKIDECLLGIGWTIDMTLDMTKANSPGTDHHMVIMIRPVFGALIMDFPTMQTFLATRIFRHSCPPALVTLCDEEKALWNSELNVPHFVHATIKLCNDIIWEGFIKSDTKLYQFSEPWLQAAEVIRFFTAIRFVIRGRNRTSECTLAEFWDAAKSTIKVHLVFPLQGGGSKEELVLVTKNRLGAFLISQGASLDDIHSFCPDFIKSVGPTKILQALDLSDGIQTMAMLNDLAGQSKMKLPSTHDLYARAATKLQQAIRRKALGTQKQLRAHQFRLAEGFFTNADKSPAHLMPKFTLQGSGICLMDRDEAKQWTGNTNLVSDELAILILGGCGNHSPHCTRLTFPAFNVQDEPVILTGCIHQFGSKDIGLPDDKQGHVDLPKSTVVSVTMWSDEWSATDWQMITKGPVKFAANMWAKQGHTDFFLGAPWNRFWKDSKGHACQHEHASSTGFFFRTPDATIAGLLRSSGENSIYLYPRSADTGKDPQWLAIWFNQPKSEVMLKGANSSFYMGLVRSPKGFGIRVASTDFKKAFESWKPGQQLPDRRYMPLLFKLKPIPKGVTGEELKEWLEKQKWDSRALKALAPDTWLVAANSPPPAPFGFFNGCSVLIKPVEKNSRSPTVVLAGTAPKAPPSKNGVDPLVKNDPWASYTGGSAVNQMNHSQNGSASNPQRSVDAPIEARFKAYDDQLQAMKTALKDVQTDLKKTSNEAQSSTKRLDGRMTSLENTVNSSIQQMSKSFADNLASALAKQDSQMASGFSELKAMLEQTAAIASPAKKLPRKDGRDGSQAS